MFKYNTFYHLKLSASPWVYVRCCPLLTTCFHYIQPACLDIKGLSLKHSLSVMIGCFVQTPANHCGTSVMWQLIDTDCLTDLRTQTSGERSTLRAKETELKQWFKDWLTVGTENAQDQLFIFRERAWGRGASCLFLLTVSKSSGVIQTLSKEKKHLPSENVRLCFMYVTDVCLAGQTSIRRCAGLSELSPIFRTLS